MFEVIKMLKIIKMSKLYKNILLCFDDNKGKNAYYYIF